MAVFPTEKSSFFNLPLAIKRLNPDPVDSSIVQRSYEEAAAYAASDPTAYIGQIISVIDQSTQTVTPYIINFEGELDALGKGTEIVSDLPTTGESNKIYLKLKEGSPNNSYEEYIWVDEKWELIGSTEIDLSNYVTTDDLTSTLETYVKSEDLSNTLSEYTTSEQLTTALSNKQDTLVSGTNIKTINNQSILGEGDIQIEGETFPEGGTTGQFLQKTDDGTTWADIDLSGKADTNGTYPDMTVGNATNATTAQSATTATSATTAETATNATHATNADRATSDVEGNAILSTYAKITALNETNTTLQEVQEKANEADAIARGKATSYVFETVTALDDWLETPENVAKLHVGDNFYIEDVGVPDYWWNGEARMVLESEKPDMSNYYSKDEVDTRLTQKANTDGTYSSMSVGSATSAQTAENATHATTADSATKATQDGDGNVISTTYVKVNQITKQDIANALGCTTSQLDTIITLAKKITVSNSEIVSSVRVTAPEFNDN